MRVSDYFTKLSGLWEEIDSMNVLPTITTITTEVTTLLNAIEKMKEESKLFQFLNGLDEVYGAQRSRLLMIIPLPSVEAACAAVQQEESQNEVLSQVVLGDNEIMAMYGKGNGGNGDKRLMCSTCGRRGHTNEKCWEVTGYPKWHYKYKPGQKSIQTKWMGNKASGAKVANNVQGGVNEQQQIVMTSQ